MAFTLSPSDMSFDLPGSPTAITPPLTWAFRQSFNPKSWTRTSGTKSGGPTWSSPSDAVSSRELAALLQLQFDEEDRLLVAERAELAAAAQHVFDCGVCMDTLPEDSIAFIEPCGHSFCRECIREFIATQIQSRRFPVLCPTCTAGKANDPQSIGKVTRELVLEIGITEEQYEAWVELEMSELFVRVQCPKGGHSSFIDREEFNEARDLTCPFTDCNYAWCKGCQQEIIPNGPEHSCDGSSELKHLAQQQGWKYCPTCNTLCEKIAGCNFISCISPGCNSHFCYKCSELVVRSAVPSTIGEGKSQHYTKCAAY